MNNLLCIILLLSYIIPFIVFNIYFWDDIPGTIENKLKDKTDLPKIVIVALYFIHTVLIVFMSALLSLIGPTVIFVITGLMLIVLYIVDQLRYAYYITLYYLHTRPLN